MVFEDYDMPGEKSPAGAIAVGGAKAAWFKDSEGNILALIPCDQLGYVCMFTSVPLSSAYAPRLFVLDKEMLLLGLSCTD